MTGTTISTSGSIGVKITTSSQQPVLVTSAGTIVSSGSYAIYIDSGSAGTITNYGLLSATGTAAIGAKTSDGGTLANHGSIEGVSYGVFLGNPNANGTVDNFGTISASGTVGVGISISGTGLVENGSSASTNWTISGARYGIDIGSGTIGNYGFITATSGVAIRVNGSGEIINGDTAATSWLLEGAGGGVAFGSSGTVINDGTIIGKTGDGVFTGSGGFVTNGSATQGGRIIEGDSYGVFLGNSNVSGTVDNFGTISASGTVGVGISISGTGLVENGSSASTNWTISGARYGIDIGSGTIGNYGFITAISGVAIRVNGSGEIINGDTAATSWLLEGAGGGVAFGSNGTVINDGTIIGKTGDGVFTGSGGLVANGSATKGGRIIEGVSYGVFLAGGNSVPGTVSNFGTISASGTTGVGVRIGAAGLIDNGSSASTGWSITGAKYGVEINGNGTVNNYGTITNTGSAGAAIDFGGTGTITNGTGTLKTWLIEGATGIADNSTGDVINDGTILGTVGSAVFTGQGGTVQNGTASETGRIIKGVSYGVFLAGGNSVPGTVSNFGTISASGTTGVGVRIGAAGLIDNGSSASTGWSITGAKYGVEINGNGTVNNYGTITNTGSAGAAIDFGGTGTITNGTGTLKTWLIEGATGIADNSTGDVINDGTILGTVGAGVSTGSGGTVQNGTAGETGRIIKGITYGVFLAGGNSVPGTVSNFGTISASGTTGVGVRIGAAGLIDNGSSASTGWSITGAKYGVEINGNGTVNNYGTITNTGSAGAAIDFGGTGTITNGTGTLKTWLIEGATGIADNSTGDVINDGTILGTVGAGVSTGSGGTVQNGTAGETGRIIKGITYGVFLAGGNSVPGTVSNFGTISASGTTGVGVRIGAAGLIDNGSSASTGWSITGAKYGVEINGNGTVNNYGTITNTGSAGAAIDFGGTGTITNGTGTLKTWLIEGATGIADNSTGDVINDGTILGTVGSAVFTGQGGTVQNGTASETGRIIKGVSYGVFLAGGNSVPGTVSNFGTISASGTTGVGVRIGASGTITNNGLISGATAAVINGTGTIFNDGTFNVSGTKGAAIQIGTGTIFNAGLIEKTAGGLSAIDAAITNTGVGTIDVSAGTLSFSDGLINFASGTLSSGHYDVDENAALQLANNSNIAVDAANITLSGTSSVIESLDTTNNTEIAIDATLGSISTGGALALLAGRNFTVVANVGSLTDAGTLALGGGTFAADALILAAGTASGFGVINTKVTDDGEIIATQSTLSLVDAITGTGGLKVDAKADLVIESTDASGIDITFGGTLAELTLDKPSSDLGTLVSLAPTDTIDLFGLAASSATISGGHLVVFLTGGGTLSYALTNANAKDRAETVTDHNGGTDIVIFSEAAATVKPNPINFGIVHVGQSISQSLTISNTASAGSYSENLDASFSGTTGDFTANGQISELKAGGENTTSLTVTMQAASAGIETGKVTVGLISDGSTIDTLGTTVLADQTVALVGTINNYATAAIEAISGPGSLNGSGPTFHLNLGSVTQGSVALTENIGILNSATGPADNLDGSLSLTGTAGFLNSGDGAFSNEAAGSADSAPIITLTTGTIGTYTETLVVSTSGTNSSGYHGALTPETLIVTGTVVARSARHGFVTAYADNVAVITASSATMAFVVPAGSNKEIVDTMIRPIAGDALAKLTALYRKPMPSFVAYPEHTSQPASAIAPGGDIAALAKIVTTFGPSGDAIRLMSQSDLRNTVIAWRPIG